MPSFRFRIRSAARSAGPLVLAVDMSSPSPSRLVSSILSKVKSVKGNACAIKLNMHALLPLGSAQIARICSAAHKQDMQVIADIKLNDIGSTNEAATKALWDMGVDAVIVNPIMGQKSLEAVVKSAHRGSHGVIALCHMSAPEAKVTYETRLAQGNMMYQKFTKGAARAKVDGIVVGATFPKIISECAKLAPDVPIYSPGIGTQGGSASRAAESGTNYFIVGRSILHASNPKTESALICKLVTSAFK